MKIVVGVSVTKNLPSIFTLLRYPGGKSKYIKRYLWKFISGNYDRFIEPFAGGASFSFFVKRLYPSKKYWINDLNYNLYCFWYTVQNYNERMCSTILNLREIYNDTESSRRNLFDIQKKNISEYDDSDIFNRGVAFYILNKISFSGLTEQGNFTSQAWDSNFSVHNINRIREAQDYIRDFTITHLDYSEVFNKASKNDFLFIDPPYDIDTYLYGSKGKLHKGFDHKNLFLCIKKLPCKFLLTYNDNEQIREWYKDYNIHDREFRYFMNHGLDNKTRTKNEIFITNISLPEMGEIFK